MVTKHHLRQLFTTGLKNSTIVIRISVMMLERIDPEVLWFLNILILNFWSSWDAWWNWNIFEDFKDGMHLILHDHLKVKKLCSTIYFTAEKDARVKWCQENLNKFHPGASKYLYDTITCNETRIFTFETKQQSTVWMFPGDPRRTKVVC